MRGLSSMGQHDLVNTARNYGIPIGENLNALRGEIANIIVENQINAEKMQTHRILENSNLEAEIVGKTELMNQ
jgi:hypothetical protein